MRMTKCPGIATRSHDIPCEAGYTYSSHHQLCPEEYQCPLCMNLTSLITEGYHAILQWESYQYTRILVLRHAPSSSLLLSIDQTHMQALKSLLHHCHLYQNHSPPLYIHIISTSSSTRSKEYDPNLSLALLSSAAA